MDKRTAERAQRTQVCETRLLTDAPAQDDAFGSHRRVANALAGMIGSETGGKAVALAGAYGSGKSTVVNLFESALKTKTGGNQSQNHVFVFDAWAHQGDPLRRSFLEELVRSLTTRGWTESQKWKRDLDGLSRRMEESDNTSTPSLTGFGTVLASSLFILPVGYSLLGKYGTDLSVKFSKVPLPVISALPDVPAWIIGLLLLFAPFLVALLIWLFLRPTLNPITSRFWTQHRKPYEDESIGSLFVRKTKEVNRSTTLRTPDPTSVEFRDIFVRILDDALLDDRRLVIVVDNLDRIPSQEDALSVWSTMRAFFDPSGHANRTWMDRFWLLVPFDSNAMTKLWASGEKDENDVGHTFLDKTFQVTFRVPPPVLTVWRDFMRDQLAKAFPDHVGKDDFGVIYRLYRRQIIPEGRPLTPRSIKLFINRIGTLHRQWGDNVPLPVQSLYVLHEQDIAQNPEAELRDGSFLKQGSLDLLGQDEWQRYLAALHYNVDPDVAIQVLIGTSVEQALLSGSSERLEELRTVPGFVEVCERVIEDNYQSWAAEEPMTLANAALAIDGIEDESDSDWEQCWRWLCRAASHVGAWRGLNDDVGRGIVSLLRHCSTASDGSLPGEVLKGLRGSFSNDEDPPETSEQWLRGALHVVRHLQKEKQGQSLRQHFRVPGSPDFYVSVIKTLIEMNIPPATSAYFSPLIEVASIEAEFVRRVSEGELDESDTVAFRFLTEMRDDQSDSWHGLWEALESKLQEGPNLDPTLFVACGKALLSMAYDDSLPEVEGTIENLCSQGYMMSHLYDMQTTGTFEATAICLLSIVDFYPEGPLLNAIMNAQPGRNNYDAIKNDPESHEVVIEALAQQIWSFHRLEAMLAHADETSSVKALIFAAVRTLAKREDAYQQFTPQLLMQHYDLLSEALAEESFNGLVEQLVDRSNLLSVIEEQVFSPDLARLYLAALRKVEGGDDFERLADLVVARAQDVTEDQWFNALEVESELLRLVIRLVKGGRGLDLTENFHDALRSHMEKVYNEGQSKGLQQDWKHVSSALRNDWRETFFRDLRDFLVAHADGKLSPVLALYGEPLLELPVISEPGKADDVVRKLFTAIVEGGAVRELEWMANALESHPEILERCPEASKKVLADRVRDGLSDDTKSDEQMDSLKRMGKVLKVRARRKNP